MKISSLKGRRMKIYKGITSCSGTKKEKLRKKCKGNPYRIMNWDGFIVTDEMDVERLWREHFDNSSI